MRDEMNSNRYPNSALYLCSDELRQNETQIGMNFISIILIEIKFQTGIRFSYEQNLLKAK